MTWYIMFCLKILNVSKVLWMFIDYISSVESLVIVNSSIFVKLVTTLNFHRKQKYLPRESLKVQNILVVALYYDFYEFSCLKTI